MKGNDVDSDATNVDVVIHDDAPAEPVVPMYVPDTAGHDGGDPLNPDDWADGET